MTDNADADELLDAARDHLAEYERRGKAAAAALVRQGIANFEQARRRGEPFARDKLKAAILGGLAGEIAAFLPNGGATLRECERALSEGDDDRATTLLRRLAGQR
jgi:hypothetical protein